MRLVASHFQRTVAKSPLLPGARSWRDRAIRWQRSLAIMLLVAFERRRKNADQVEIAMRTQFMSVPGPDIVSDTRLEHPRFARSEVGHLCAPGRWRRPPHGPAGASLPHA
jgi:hypothetical protein